MTIQKLLVFTFFIFFNYTSAQQVISGRLKTAKNKPIEGANIVLKTINENTTVSYDISNKTGGFSIKAKTGEYLLKISYLGFKTVSRKITVNLEDINLQTIILKEDTSELEEVVLKAESRILIKGDTTIYKTASFLNGTEQNLSDILQNLPGLDINDKDKVTLNGKEIDRLLVNGENLYKNQHKFATENIAAKIVGNIEVIKNHLDFGSIRTQGKSGLTALNVNIKDDFKNKITGTINTGGGVKNKYEFRSALFSFNKKTKSSLITNFNNTGTNPISIEDYIDLTDPITIEPGSSSNVIFSNIEDVPRFLSVGDKVKSRVINFATISSIVNPTEKIKIDFYGIFNASKQEEAFLSNQQLTANNNSFSIAEENKALEKNYFGIGHLKAIYKRTEKSIFAFNSNINMNLSNQNLITENKNNNSIGFFIEKYKPKEITTNSNLTYTGKVDNAIFKTSLFLNYIDVDANKEITANKPFLNFDFDNTNFYILQDLKKRSLFSGLNLKYSINKRIFKFNITSSTSLADEKLYSTIKNTDQNDNKLNLSTVKSNIGTDFTLKLSKLLSYTVGANYNYLLKKFKGNTTEIKYIGFNTNLKVEVNSNNIGNLGYTYSKNTPTIDNLIENAIVVNYRNLTLNDDVSFQSLYPYHKINYQHFIFFPQKKMSVIFNASHKFNKKAINNDIVNSNNLTISKYKTVNNDRTTSLLLFTRKQFLNVPFSVSNSVSYDTSYKDYFQDNLPSIFKSERLSGKLQLASKFEKSPIHIKMGYQYTFEKFQFDITESKFTVQEPFVNLKGAISSSLTWKLNTIYKNFNTNDTKRNVFYVNPELNFSKKNSNWEYTLTGTNILNLNSENIVQNRTLPGVREQKITSILEGSILFSLKYKL